MSGFVVDSRTLAAVRDTLGRLHDQLTGMHTVVWQEHGTLGGQMLEAELEHFCGTWHYGVAELGGQLQDLTRRLSEAAAAYERIEERITHATGGGTAPGGPRYSGGAGLAPASGGTSHPGDHKHPRGPRRGKAPPSGDQKHSGDKHPTEHRHPGVGSGTTVIPPGPPAGGSHHGGSRHRPGSGTGVTVIGGGGPASGSAGSGTTTVDEKIHHAEARQRDELAAALKVAEK